MRPDLYVPIAEKKVFQEAATHSGISAGVIKAAWDAAGEVIRTWATEGHSIPLPGHGTMRFGVRSKAVEKLEDVPLKAQGPLRKGLRLFDRLRDRWQRWKLQRWQRYHPYPNRS